MSGKREKERLNLAASSNDCNFFQMSTIWEQVLDGNIAAVLNLLGEGVGVDERNWLGETPLLICARHGLEEMASVSAPAARDLTPKMQYFRQMLATCATYLGVSSLRMGGKCELMFPFVLWRCFLSPICRRCLMPARPFT